jgi:hypothetical protein
MFRNKSQKFDMSFLNYLNEDNINSNHITIEQIKKQYPDLAKSNLGCLNMFFIINFKTLTENEKQEVQNKIKILQEMEENKFINAFNYIEECQQQKQDLIQN